MRIRSGALRLLVLFRAGVEILEVADRNLSRGIDRVRHVAHVHAEELSIHEQEALRIRRIGKTRERATFQRLDVARPHARRARSLLHAELPRLPRLSEPFAEI